VIRPIDLTPASARARANRRASTRRWIGAYAAIFTLGAVATAGARLRTAALERELSLASEQLASTNERLSAVGEISTELATIADTLELQRRVLPRPSVTEILREIEVAAPQSMAFTTLTLDQRRTTNASSIRAARKAGENEPAQISTSVQIAGVTPDDAAIVRLIQAMDRTGLFNGSSLEYSRPLVVRSLEAREFRIVASAPTWSVDSADAQGTERGATP
jgi:hypothetical protein